MLVSQPFNLPIVETSFISVAALLRSDVEERTEALKYLVSAVSAQSR